LFRKGATICLGAVVVLAAGIPHTGIRWNHTPSMAIGLWLERPSARAYVAGDIVEVCPVLPDRLRVYLAPGNCPTGLEPMLKPIAAVAGDQIVVDQAGVTVNGAAIPNTASRPRNPRGRPLQPYPAGTYEVSPGQVWLIVPRPDSLDGRYLGPIPVDAIKALATPIWVFR
jgi:conjugative transfer signal peptidase TraF